MNARLVFPVLLLLASCSTPTAPPPAPPPPPPLAAPATHHHPTGTSGMMALQRELAKRGYYHYKVDGQDGPHTRAAVARFQQDMGVQPVTGEADDQTWSALGLSEGHP